MTKEEYELELKAAEQWVQRHQYSGTGEPTYANGLLRSRRALLHAHAENEMLKRAVDLTLPLMERYEGQGEGGTAEFNIAMEALHRAALKVAT